MRKQKGQSLFEVVITLVVIGIILSGLVKVIVVSIKNMDYSRNQNLALNLAQSKIEDLIQERDATQWSVFWNKYFEIHGGQQIETNLGQNEIFSRDTVFTNISDPPDSNNLMKIQVTVTWEDSQGEHRSFIESHLTEWK